MQVTEKSSEKLKREYSVVVKASELQKEVDKKLTAIGKTAKIPGFRPGKIPADVLKKNYGKSVMGEVLEKTVDNTSRKAMEQEKLRPATQPKIEIVKFEEGSDLEYTMALEILPEVPTLDYTRVKMESPTSRVEDKDVDKALETLAGQQKDFSAVERAAKNGDAIKIDFKGMLDGEAFPGGTAKDFQLELGSNTFIPGFEEQLTGKKAGDECEVKVTFPKEYHSKDLAGKDTVFEVKIHEVLEAKPAKIDDEFAKKLGLESLDKMKEEIKAQLQREYDSACRTLKKRLLFDILDKEYSFEVPEGMAENEFRAIWRKVEEEKKANPDAFKESDEKLKKDLQKMAERRVRLGILLSETGNREKVGIDQHEIANAITEQAKHFPGQEGKVMEYYQNNPGAVQEIRGPLLEEKVVDFILGKATLSEKEISVDELKKKLDELETDQF